ncbi:MAG: hypothetical protein HKN03_06920 [Acidimicrobiales bacterium]|nr:hypothetical protein [Acidimicrobiales bacterium]
MHQRQFATVVVGAGPAGLLFCLTAALRNGPEGLVAAPILLVDKRTSYERSHRLRMDRRPYLAAQATLDHPLFDDLIAFLTVENFRPAANMLEAKLEKLVSETGISKRQMLVGSGEGATDLAGVRQWLEDDGVLVKNGCLMVVGADSVNSETRKLVAHGNEAIEKVHQTVARLRVEAEGLPLSLDLVRQLKLAKLLGSAIDYRFNQNGYAEIDLFLSPAEHAAVESLGARPAEPVTLTSDVLDHLNAPLFSAVVDHVGSDLTPNAAKVMIQSTFRLEHRYQQRVAFGPDEYTGVFLVGDAAVSLPFFRGMACLMECADVLASVHAELVTGSQDPPHMAEARRHYNESVKEIRDREIAIVESRARAVRLARELVRVSSMAPFPIQTWLLSAKRPARPQPRFTPRLAGTVVLVVLAAVFALSSPIVGIAGLVCLPIQAAAGVVYRWDLASPRRPNPAIAMVCRSQVLVLMIAGALISIFNPFRSGWLIRAGAAIGWWVLGLVFVAGMYLYEEFRPAAVEATGV